MFIVQLVLFILINLFLIVGVYDIYRTWDIYKNFKKNEYPSILETPKINCENKKLSQEVDKSVIDFERKLIKLNHCNLDFFYCNASNLVIDRSFLLKNFHVTHDSCYYIRENKIVLGEFCSTKHELVHMATTIIGEVNFCGFSQNNFCNGINEGYTELIAERHFKAKKGTYPVELKIVNI